MALRRGAFFGRLAAVGIGVDRQRVLDLGTGTGTLARGFARRGCAVTAFDASAGIGASLPPEAVAEFDAERGRVAGGAFPRGAPGRALAAPHRVFAIFATKT